jgi:hypothetical protein
MACFENIAIEDLDAINSEVQAGYQSRVCIMAFMRKLPLSQCH